jgi:hypothetical protein
MNAAATVPLVVTPEAQQFIAERGLQSAFEQMIEHARQTIPRLRELSVTLEPPYDTGDEMTLVLQATMDRPEGERDRTEFTWGYWKAMTFPPEVSTLFTLLTVYTNNHGR